MAVNIYPTAIDKVRIQRVADVMYQFGLLQFPVQRHADDRPVRLTGR